jgi:hypothetical protein
MDQWSVDPIRVGCWYLRRHEVQNNQNARFWAISCQIMQQHTKEVRELALTNGPVIRDTFLLPSDVRNICRKRAEELWMKHLSDPISVRMWTLENLDSVFYY